jgi:DNA-binding ferritin-like protein
VASQLGHLVSLTRAIFKCMPKSNVSKPYRPATDDNLMVTRPGKATSEEERRTATKFLQKMGLKREAPNEDRVVTSKPTGMVTRAAADFIAPDMGPEPPDFRTAVVEPMMAIVGGLEAAGPPEPQGFTPTFPMSMQPGQPTLTSVMAQSCDALCSEYGNSEFAPLAVLLVALRSVGWLHQSAHWQASSDPFYADHLLFQRLYDQLIADIDKVAEKAVGMGAADLVDPAKQASQLSIVLSWCCSDTGLGSPAPSMLAQRSLKAERLLLELLECISAKLSSAELLTPGVENMLSDLADVHESHVYLLKQRCSAR